MTEVDLSDITDAFLPTLEEEVTQRLNERDAPVKDRLIAYGARLVLQGGATRHTRTAVIAKDLETTESTIFRIYPGQLIDSIEQDGGISLRESYITPRHQALTEAAVRLTVDEKFSFGGAVARWSRVYAGIANPSGLFTMALARPKIGREVVEEHAHIITRSINLFGIKDGVRVDETFGKLVMHTTAGIEMFDRSNMGLETEGILHTLLRSRRVADTQDESKQKISGSSVNDIASRIRTQRVESGLSQAEFGAQYGLSRYAIHRVENGKTRSLSALNQIAYKIYGSSA